MKTHDFGKSPSLVCQLLLGTIALMCTATSSPAQSILLSAGDFALLGGTAITSTGTAGTSIRNGNVGLSPGATTGITGFPPAVIVNGAIIATGPVTAQARLDLITASIGLAGMPSNANMSTVDLGGKTLAPGVYTFNGAASLSGALVLDAQGQNNVAWVFQIGTALTTAINSTVTFINLGSNGGSDLGLFWNAGSAINIGANNQTAGNYLAGTSIVFGGLSSGGGRALALAGISLDSNVVNARGGLGGGDFSGGLKYSLLGAVVPSGGSGSTTTVTPGATDGGIGTVGGNLVNNGTVTPGIGSGVAPGTLAVANNFTQGSTGVLVMQLASATSFDRLAVTGTATLGGTLQIDTAPGFDPVGLSFPVITAGGGVIGTFGTLSGNVIATNRAAIRASVNYGANTVTVAFAQLPFSGFAATANQRAVANAAQASAPLTVALDAIPLASQFPAALNALSPQGYEIWSDVAFAHATALTDRLVRDDRATPGRDDYYFDVSQRRGRSRSDADVGTSTFTSTAGLVGANHVVDADLTFGIFFEHGKTIGDLGAPGSRTTIKDDTFGLRAAWTPGPLFARAVLGYGFQKYESTRPIVFPGTSTSATSSTKGHQWLADFTLGQRLTTGAVTLSPFAGVQASRWEANGFTETGAGAFNLTLAKQKARSLRTQLGLEAGLNWQAGSVGLQPHVKAAWLHEFSNGARTMDASFGTTNYAVTTHKPQRDSALLGAGFDILLSPTALIYTDYTAQTGGVTRILSQWRLGVALSF